MGVSSVIIGPEVMLERTDAEAIKEGEEVTLMRWGNVKATAIKRNEEGAVIDITGEFIPNVMDICEGVIDRVISRTLPS